MAINFYCEIMTSLFILEEIEYVIDYSPWGFCSICIYFHTCYLCLNTCQELKNVVQYLFTWKCLYICL